MEINRYLDHAVLKPDYTQAEARDLIQKGIDYKVRTVCVRPCDIELAVTMCRDTETEVSVVLSFPHGCGHTEVKAAEAACYCRLGVSEIDMVANYGWLKSGELAAVVTDIKAVCDEAHKKNVAVKVILETSELSASEIRDGVKAAIEAGADFVKTSTGFASGGATEDAVRIMIEEAAGQIKVKPSGGIRDAARARMFIEMGADRLGTGATSVEAICGSGPANNSTGY